MEQSEDWLTGYLYLDMLVFEDVLELTASTTTIEVMTNEAALA